MPELKSSCRAAFSLETVSGSRRLHFPSAESAKPTTAHSQEQADNRDATSLLGTAYIGAIFQIRPDLHYVGLRYAG